MRRILTTIAAALLSGCSALKVVETDPITGYFPGDKRAAVVTNIPLDMDNRKDLILVPNDDFTGDMVRNIGFFDNVMNFEDLEKTIINENLTDAVPSVDDRIGLNKAAKAYKPFLWLRWDDRKDGSKHYGKLILTDPITLEDYFVAETLLDFLWRGVNDQNNFYPMMNSFIDYLKENSREF